MQIILCDIDNTLIKHGIEPMQNVIGWLNARHGKYRIVLLTGRLESDRPRTVETLNKAGIKYDQLIMNNRTIHEKCQHKGDIARILNKNGQVAIAIDNDPDCREAISNAGVKLVVAPEELSDSIIKSNVWGGVFTNYSGLL